MGDNVFIESNLSLLQSVLELIEVHIFQFDPIRHPVEPYNGNMKVKLPKPAPNNQRVREIQQWLGTYGGSVANAYVVNAGALRELGAERGVLEKILWRVPREKPELPLTGEAMMEILAARRLMREVRKQLKLDSHEHQAHTKAFEQSRQQLIASKIPAGDQNREAVIREVESWFKMVLPEMRNTKAILRATELRLEARRDIHPVLPPLRATTELVEQLNKREPGRVYIDKDGGELLLLKPGEQAVLDEKGLRIENGAPAMPAPGMD
jgi:hypothetical protein